MLRSLKQTKIDQRKLTTPPTSPDITRSSITMESSVSTFASSDSILDMSLLYVMERRKIKEGEKSQRERNSKPRKNDNTRKNEKKKKKKGWTDSESEFWKSFENLDVEPFDEDCFDVGVLYEHYSESSVTKFEHLRRSMPNMDLDSHSEEARQIPPSRSSRSMDMPCHATDQRSLKPHFVNGWNSIYGDWTKYELTSSKTDDDDDDYSHNELEAAIDKQIDENRQRTKAQVVEPIFWKHSSQYK
jgi:hypothetical protein